MIVARFVARLDTALQNHDASSLASLARDLGDELIRKRTAHLRKLLSGIDAVNHRLNGSLLTEEKACLMVTTNILHAAIAALEQEEHEKLLTLVLDRYREILGVLHVKRVTADELAVQLGKDLASVKEALAKLLILGMVECSGIRQFWELTTAGSHLFKQLA